MANIETVSEPNTSVDMHAILFRLERVLKHQQYIVSSYSTRSVGFEEVIDDKLNHESINFALSELASALEDIEQLRSNFSQFRKLLFLN